MPPLGAREPAYIVPPNEYGPSDQTDLNRTIFLDPQRRWSIILEAEPEWWKSRAGTQGGRASALPPGPLGLLFVPVASEVF